MSTQPSFATANCKPREYNHANDEKDVRDMCKDVYGGHDHVPMMLVHYAEDPCSSPMVLERSRTSSDGPRVVAFANLRNLKLGTIASRLKIFACERPQPCYQDRQIENITKVCFVEAVRVDPALQGNGLGKRLVDEVARAATTGTNRENVALFAATIPSNIASLKIFERNGFQRIQSSHVWPSLRFGQTFSCPGMRMLTAMGLDNVSSDSLHYLDHWVPVVDEMSFAHALQGCGGMARGGIVLGYYSVMTADEVWSFVSAGFATVWMLQSLRCFAVFGRVTLRVDGLPAALVYAETTKAAEAAVMFAENRLGFGRFEVVLDSRISRSDIRSSRIFGRIEAEEFILLTSKCDMVRDVA
jgi:GNAT superfamily N-acetyltransferase